jgi:hypothetical protein
MYVLVCSAAAASHLREKYHAANGQRVDRLFKDGITPADSVCDILAADLRRREIAAHPPEKPWLTCVIDEAHMLRNPSALWAMLAAAIGTHSHRLMSATGTPFNNRMQDMGECAALAFSRPHMFVAIGVTHCRCV